MKNAPRLPALVILSGLILLGLMAYQPSFQAPFELDDYLRITHNPTIKEITSFRQIWEYDPSRFLGYWSLALNYHFGKLNVLGYHIFNFSVHLLTGIIFYFFARLTLSKESEGYAFIAACATCIFLLHPVQTGAVTYIYQRITLIAVFFYLSSLYCYALYRFDHGKQFYVLSIAAGLLGALSKPILVTLPFAIYLYEVCFLQKSWKLTVPDWKRITPYLCIPAAVLIALHLWKFQTFEFNNIWSLTSETPDISRKDYLLTQFNVLVTYIRLLFIPANLNLDYDYPIAQSFFAFPTWASFCVLAAIVFAGFASFRKNRIMSFCIFWFFVTLSSESSIIPIQDVIFEHRLYLPMIGFSLFLPVIVQKLITNSRARHVALVFIIGLYALLTYQRNVVWADKIRFLTDMAEKSPQKPRVQYELGHVYYEKGEHLLALKYLNRALGINPRTVRALHYRALVYKAQGKIDLALADLNKALQLRPDFDEAHNNRGTLYAKNGRLDLAVVDFTQAIQSNPHYTRYYTNRGIVYKALKEYDLAIADFDTALRLKPDDIAASLNRELCLQLKSKNSPPSH